MKIAIFDYRVTPTKPVGSCHRRMLSARCEEHELVVFAPEFDNPRPDRIDYLPIREPRRPLALLFVLFPFECQVVAWQWALSSWRWLTGGPNPRYRKQSLEE